MDATVSADEARDMLDGETRGVHGCSLADAAMVGRDILSNAVVYGGTPPALHRACDMLDDVERLARTVIALREGEQSLRDESDRYFTERNALRARVAELEARLQFADAGLKQLTDAGWNVTTERDRLRAIIAGRTTPPTDAEFRAHATHGGRWLVTRRMNGRPFAEVLCSRLLINRRRTMGGAQRWVPMRDGRPCAWPVTP